MFWNSKLKAMMKEKDDQICRLEQQLSSERNKLSSSESGIDKRNEEISTLKKQLRKQNSADILVNAFEAVGIIPTDKKKDYHAEQSRLLAMQQQYNQSMRNASGQQQYNSGSLFGLGSMF